MHGSYGNFIWTAFRKWSFSKNKNIKNKIYKNVDNFFLKNKHVKHCYKIL